MTTRRNLFLLLAAGLSTLASAQVESTMEVEVNGGMYEKEISSLRQGHRELYNFGSFSFSSLLFALHMCDVDPTCPEKKHRPPINPYCPGCPDCNHIKKPEEWLKGWCAKNSGSSSASDGTEAAEGEVDQSEAVDADVEKNGAGGTPSAARTMNWLIFAAAAGVALTALVAAAMRKRQEEEGDGMKASDPNHLLTGSIAKRMMGGMGLSAFGGGDESTIVTEDNTMGDNTLGTNFIAMDPVSEAPETEAPVEQGIEIDEGNPIVPFDESEPIVPGSRYQV